MAMKIKSGDQVEVISGKDKGKQGQVLRTDPKKSVVFVENANMVKRHQRAMPSPSGQGPGKEGGIIEMEGPIHISNVMLLDPTDNKPTRVGIRVTDDGKRQRFSKRTGETV
jgi:large subunit ribosomal protein L24